MKRSRKVAIAIVMTTLVIVGGLKVWIFSPPLHLNFDGPAGKVLRSVSECAQAQKRVYLVFEEYQRTYSQAPSDIWDLVHKINMTNKTYVCPAADEHESGRFAYKLYPENYGHPDAVFIEESRNSHLNTFILSFRGIKPCVQTMGDGTIHLFNEGQVATTHVHDK